MPSPPNTRADPRGLGRWYWNNCVNDIVYVMATAIRAQEAAAIDTDYRPELNGALAGWAVEAE